MKKALFTFVSALALPVVALAQEFNPDYINGVLDSGTNWLSLSITILMAVMTLWFLWSVFKFIAEKDPKEMPNRRKQMINGLIGLFVAVGVWGIIELATNVFDINTSQDVDIVCPPGYVPDGGICVID